MKTEIDRICGIMYTLLEHQPVIDVPYEKINDIAVALVKKGYGDVSEYKSEIERLKAEFKQLETNAEILARGVRDLNHENYELTEKIKQAQIDVLKKLRSRISDKEALIQSYIADGCLTIGDMYTEIDELIKEVQNAEDKS